MSNVFTLVLTHRAYQVGNQFALNTFGQPLLHPDNLSHQQAAEVALGLAQVDAEGSHLRDTGRTVAHSDMDGDEATKGAIDQALRTHRDAVLTSDIHIIVKPTWLERLRGHKHLELHWQPTP
ncbi:hypothetical protein [Nocardia salmonicida]|uniref:hypothetical protein n=1 Tax=Nocardia salmonicida TaxID=53431 RepID=UPI0007A521B2|nr:hypothetical protein [Nocardia salmonicida]MBC7299462.1 hypothetical protein [Nocardia sp.]